MYDAFISAVSSTDTIDAHVDGDCIDTFESEIASTPLDELLHIYNIYITYIQYIYSVIHIYILYA